MRRKKKGFFECLAGMVSCSTKSEEGCLQLSRLLQSGVRYLLAGENVLLIAGTKISMVTERGASGYSMDTTHSEHSSLPLCPASKNYLLYLKGVK